MVDLITKDRPKKIDEPIHTYYRSKKERSLDYLAQITRGEERMYPEGGPKYLHVSRTLEEVEANFPFHKPIIDYIRRNISSIYRGSNLFNSLSPKLTNDLVFLDIETAGFTGLDTIHTISMARLNGHLSIETYFARTTAEEEATVSLTIDKILSPNVCIFTYNGKSFDIPRLNARAQSWGLVDRGLKLDPQRVLFRDYSSPAKMANALLNGRINEVNVKSHIEDHEAVHEGHNTEMFIQGKNFLSERTDYRHFDLMHMMTNYFKIKKKRQRDRTLQTLEREYPFFVHRQGDIKSSRIPQAYWQFIYEDNNHEEIAKIIDHNTLDTVSLIALLSCLCKGSFDVGI